MNLKERIEQDLKTALLARDQGTVLTLRSIKSAILNEEVAKGLREQGLDDQSITQVLVKEAKKRQESADLYRQGKEETRANQELAEKAIIDGYLPKQLSETELSTIVDKVIKANGAEGPAMLGQVIGQVKQEVGATADGATVARLVKERLS
jgi:uncharacterized protein